MALSFRKFISEVLVNGKFPKILPSKNFPLYVTVWVKTGLVRTCQYFEKYHFKNSIKDNQPCLGSGDIHWV